MAKENRTGRVSSVDYAAGTYTVTYFDRGKSVTRLINAVANGEYKMPSVGQVVSVSHNSNGAAAATAYGTIWNKTNRPQEGYKGLYRKEYGEKPGQAYSRYDANTGVYTQYVNKRTGRICNGEIYDEAKGPASLYAGGTLQLKGKRTRLQAAEDAEITSDGTMNIASELYINIESQGDIAESANGGKKTAVAGDIETRCEGNVSCESQGNVVVIANGATIMIDTSGGITINGATKIEMSAPEINITGGTGSISINGISLTEHTHEDGGNGKSKG